MRVFFLELVLLCIIGAAVPLDDFSEYTKHMHDDRDKLFEDEYCVRIINSMIRLVDIISSNYVFIVTLRYTVHQ